MNQVIGEPVAGTALDTVRHTLKDEPELLMLRHHDVRRSCDRYSQAELERYLVATTELRRRAVRYHLKGPKSFNRYHLGRYSLTEQDVEHFVQVWTIGYLSTRGANLSEIDGRLRNYINQRFVELVRAVRRKAQDCAPEVGDTDMPEFQEASMSAASRALDEPDDTETVVIRTPSAKLLLLERLAVYDHVRAAEDFLAAPLTCQGEPDGRSQAAKLTREMRECSAWNGTVGSGDCSVCAVRHREQDGAILALPEVSDPVLVREWLEGHLGTSRAFQLRLTRARMRGETTSKLPEACRHAARALGLVAVNSNRTFSTTSSGYELLTTAPGSPEECALLRRLVAQSPTFHKHPGSAWERIQIVKKTQIAPPIQLAEQSIAPVRSPSFPAIRVCQNGLTFYLSAVPSDVLGRSCFVDRASEGAGGYQRDLDEKRADAIGKYMASQGAVLPCSIVLSATEKAQLQFDESTNTVSFLETKAALGCVEGQHRVAGLSRGTVQLPVAIFVGLDASQEAAIFINISDETKHIPPSVLLAAKTVAGTETPSERQLRELFEKLSTDDRSPLKGVLKIGGISKGKLTRSGFDFGVSRAQKSQLFQQLETNKLHELALNFLRAFHDALDDKSQLWRRTYFAAIWELFGELTNATKNTYGNLKLSSLQTTIRKVANVSGRLQKDIVGAMRAALNQVEVSASDI